MSADTPKNTVNTAQQDALLHDPILNDPIADVVANLPTNASLSPVIITGMVRLLDFSIITVTGMIVYAIYLVPRIGFSSSYAMAIPAIGIVTVIILQILDMYNLAALRSIISKGAKLVVAWGLSFMLAFAIFFFTRIETEFSRAFFGSWFVVGLIGLIAERLITQYYIKKLTLNGRLDRRTAIVGGGAACEALIKALSKEDSDLRIFGVFDDRNDDRSPESVSGYPKLGNIDNLVEFSRRSRLDLVIFSLPVTAEARLLQMLRKLMVLPIDIRLAAHAQKLRFRPRNYSYVAGTPVFDMADKPIADWDVVLKWLFDKSVGILMLIFLSPVMLITAIAIKLNSKGPVFFRQKRYGFNNEMIEVFKFRSMYTNMSDATAAQLVTKDDPRVTNVGRFIRKTSIDELPQLFNVVFKGDLSLIGPRPHAAHAKAVNKLYDEVVDGYFARHRVKPGITGWAQINGWRGETDTEDKIQKRVECDLYYIENWSVFLDAYILLMTPFALTKTQNAY
jgi:Undecaprenyl-phosphate glucose phosphotransferase